MISFPAPLGVWIDGLFGGAAVISKISFDDSAGEDANSRKESDFLLSLPGRLPMVPTASIGEDDIDIGLARVLDGDDGDERIRKESVGEGSVKSRGPNMAVLVPADLPVDFELKVGGDDFGSDSDSAMESTSACRFVSLFTDFSAEP